MIRHIWAWIQYIIVLAVLLFLQLFNNHTVTLTLLIFAIIAPAFSMTGFFLCRKKITASVSMSPDFTVRNDSIRIIFSIKNPTWYPFTRVYVHFSVYHINGVKTYSHRINLSGIPFSTDRYEMPVSFAYCGVYRVELTETEACGLLNLTGYSKNISDVFAEAVVMPGTVSINEQALSLTGQSSEEEDSQEELLRGDDRSEVFDIRDYAPGDSMHDIHWKLSAKADSLLVKEFSDTSGEMFVLFLETKYKDLPSLDAFFDLLQTVCDFFLRSHMKYSVCYYSGGSMKRVRVRSEEDIAQLITALYYNPQGKDDDYTVLGMVSAEGSPKSSYLISTEIHSMQEGMTSLFTNKNLVRMYRISER